MKKKIDSREIVRNARKLIEHDLMTKQATLFDVSRVMETLEEWYGGEVYRFKYGTMSVIQLAFTRTEINVSIGTFDDFTVRTMFITWVHNRTKKMELLYDAKEDGSFDVFGVDCITPLYNVPFCPELAA